jgi:hypothetical protein
MSEYTPTWAGGVPDVDPTPAEERHGDGVTHDHEEAHSTDAGEAPDEPTVRSGPPTFGEERHPHIIVGGTGFDVNALHKCNGRWKATGYFREYPARVLDADRDGECVFAGVCGTRKGDTWTGDLTVRGLEHDGERWRAAVEFPEGEIGALWRWRATGCLVCGGEQW